MRSSRRPAGRTAPDVEKIVVGVDGSEQSRDALRFALEEAELRRVPVAVVHAWSAPIPLGDPLVGPAPIDYPGLVEELQAAAQRLVDEIVEEVAGAKRDRVRVEALAVEGPAATVLLDAARAAGMIVVASRGRGGFAKLVLGSVSEQVARHAPCPVLIHRTKPEPRA
jgi:nucleotide-binding universal stress UspA family protein